MDSETLVLFLDEFFAAMTKVVVDYEGTVDKYIGDAMMVFYGAPIEQEDHAVRACKTAVEMLFRLEELRVRWKARNLPCMNIGVGINSGAMSVGNIGSAERFDYTIMGDNVNLASRLEGINKVYGTSILISQATFDLIQGNAFTVRELDSVRVKGKNEAVTIYELFGCGSYYQHKQTLASVFNAGLAAYREQQWDQAMVSFREALRITPADIPSQIYVRRCETYKQQPPPEDLAGVFVIETK
jgi:adenylate cyclase